jgi:8-oxo-dGTP pyrophosphatase MutT (NUDIX family)
MCRQDVVMDNAPDEKISRELVDVVDENDIVQRVVTRREMRSQRLRHRAVFIAVIDESGRLLVHRRSPLKDVWPNWCDIAIGGVVGTGEDFLTAAYREVQEEIGIDDVVIQDLDDGLIQTYDDAVVSLLGRCYFIRHSGPFTFADGEVVEAWWSTRAEFEILRQREQFLPDSQTLLIPRLTLWK